MSKYNLSDLVKEYIGGGRIGTLKISYKDLLDKMDDLEKSGKVIVRSLSGPSGDGKVNREFEVVDRDSAVPGGNKQERGFTVYDYKFGFDPGSEEHFMEEYDFSVGGNDLKLAMELIDGVEEYGISIREDKKINEGDLFSSEFDRQELKAIINDLNKGLILDMPTRRAYKFLVSLLDKEDKEELGLNEDISLDNVDSSMQSGEFKQKYSKLKNSAEMKLAIDKLMDLFTEQGDGVTPEQLLGMVAKELDKELEAADKEGQNKTQMNEADNMEIVTLLNRIRKHLFNKFDRRYRKPEFDLYMDSLERDMRRSEKEFDEVKSMSMEDIEAEFEDYIADRYDDLREDFKRFM